MKFVSDRTLSTTICQEIVERNPSLFEGQVIVYGKTACNFATGDLTQLKEGVVAIAHKGPGVTHKHNQYEAVRVEHSHNNK